MSSNAKLYRAVACLLVLFAAHCGDDQGSPVPDAGVVDERGSVELTAVAGNTPTVRLEQDDSSGFQPQIWDLGGNESGFFLRDRSNGATMPVRIEPGAPSNRLFVGVGGVGVGTSTPEGTLDVRGTDGATTLSVVESSTTAAMRNLLTLRNNGGVMLRLENALSGTAWSIRNAASGALFITADGTGTNELAIDASGNATLAGSLTTGGPTCGGGCDAVFTPAFDLESIEEHADYMWSHQHLAGVGPTPEGEPLNLSDKTTGILNELEKAHLYIAELNEAIKAKDAQLLVMERRLRRLEALVDQR